MLTAITGIPAVAASASAGAMPTLWLVVTRMRLTESAMNCRIAATSVSMSPLPFWMSIATWYSSDCSRSLSARASKTGTEVSSMIDPSRE